MSRTPSWRLRLREDDGADLGAASGESGGGGNNSSLLVSSSCLTLVEDALLAPRAVGMSLRLRKDLRELSALASRLASRDILDVLIVVNDRYET